MTISSDVDYQRDCPYCAEPIHSEAIKCKHCGSVLTEQARDVLAREIAEQSDAGNGKDAASNPIIPDSEATARLVTVVFADITGFTELSRDHNPNEIREIINAHFSEYVSVIEQYGGEVDKYIGDEVMAIWGTEETREDDALRACRAGLDMVEKTREQAKEMDLPTALHVGINTGRVVYGRVGAGDHTERTVLGDVVNLASRLCAVADSGSVMVGSETWSRVQDRMGGTEKQFELKGIGSTSAVELSAVQQGVAESETSDSVVDRFNDRDTERETLHDLLSRFREGKPERNSVLVRGKRGTGKSRLCRHVLKQYSDDLPILFSQCISSDVPRLGGVVADWLRDFVNRSPHHDVDALLEARELDGYERLVELLMSDDMGRSSLSDPAPEQAADLFVELAESGPLVLVVADLQWADGLSLDVIKQLVNDSRTKDKLLFVGEGRPGDPLTAVEESTKSEVIDLNPLTRQELDDFLDELFEEPPPEQWVDTIWDQTRGVMLHLVQVLEALGERDEIVATDGTGQYELSGTEEELPVPDTLSDLLWSRIDQLPSEQKDTVQRASVCGFRFPRETIVLASDDPEQAIDDKLNKLQERGLIVDGGEEVAFQNRSIRETARDMLLPSERRGLANQILDELGKRRRSSQFRPILPELLKQAERVNELREVQSIQAYQHLRAFRRDEAERLLDRAGEEPWGDEPEARKARASYLNARARLAEANNDLETALKRHREAVSILRELNEPNDLAHSLILVSRMAVKCQEWSIATEATEESLERSRELDHTGAVAKATYMMGWLNEVQDDWESALEWYEETLDLEGRESGMGRAYSVSGIARAYEHLGREEEALQYHKESVECLSHEEWMERNPHVYALNLESYGWNEWRLNQTTEGVRYLRRSLEVVLNTSDAPVVSSLLNRFVRVSNQIGEEKLARFFAERRDKYIETHRDQMGSYDPDASLNRYEPGDGEELDSPPDNILEPLETTKEMVEGSLRKNSNK